MIGKSRTGADFSGLAGYLTEGGDVRVSRVETRNTFESNPEKVAQEMKDAASLSERVQKPVYHLSVSFPVEDETSQEDRIEVIDEVLEDLGLEDHQTLVVEHQDASHPHVHAMVNRVQHDPQSESYGTAWSNSYDWKDIEASLRRIEQERDWRQVAGFHARPRGEEEPSPAPSTGEIQKYKRTGELPFGDVVAEVAGHHFEEASSWDELEHRLSDHGIRVEPKGRGGVVTDGSEVAKLSDVGREYSRYKLEQKFDESHAEYRKRRNSKPNGIEKEAAEQKRAASGPGGENRLDSRADRGVGGRPGEGSGRRSKAEGRPDRGASSRSEGGADETEVRRDSAGERADVSRDEEKDWGVHAGGGKVEEPREDRDGSERQLRGENRDREGALGGTGEGAERDQEQSPKSGTQGGTQRRSGERHPVAGDVDHHSRVNRGSHGRGRGDGRSSVGRSTDASERREADEPGEEDATAREDTSNVCKRDDRERIREVPGSLAARERESTSGPNFTQSKQLTDRERDIWNRLVDGGKEEAARAFNQLSKAKQRQFVEKLDRFDRDDLRKGFERAIDRDTPDREETGQDASRQRQSDSKQRDRGGSRDRSRSGRMR